MTSKRADHYTSGKERLVTDTIKWGPEIKVDGKRPAWLKGDGRTVDCMATYGHKWISDSIPVECNLRDLDRWTWNYVEAIRLPETHFAYTAIEQGFEPWGGGDEAPADWDGTAALGKDGAVVYGNFNSARWDTNIIGYRKIGQETPYAETTYPPALVERMVELVRHASAFASGHTQDEARAIMAELEPVDPDLVEARRLASDGMPHHKQAILDGSRDGSPIVSTALAAIKRGRELERNDK